MTAELSAKMVDRDEKYKSMLAKVRKMDGILVNQAAIIKRQDNQIHTLVPQPRKEEDELKLRKLEIEKFMDIVNDHKTTQHEQNEKIEPLRKKQQLVLITHWYKFSGFNSDRGSKRKMIDPSLLRRRWSILHCYIQDDLSFIVTSEHIV